MENLPGRGRKQELLKILNKFFIGGKFFIVGLLTLLIALIVRDIIRGGSSNSTRWDEKYTYTISMFKIPIVKASMKVRKNGIYKGLEVIELLFEARTKRFFESIFSADNSYKTIISKTSGDLLFFSKKINQSNMRLSYEITYDNSNGIALYPGGDTLSIPSGIQNLFSLMSFLRYRVNAGANEIKVPLEIEGSLWEAAITFIGFEEVKLSSVARKARKHRVKFRPKNNAGGKINHKTDVLTNRMANPDGELQFWIEEGGKHRILKITYRLWPFSLLAKMEE